MESFDDCVRELFNDSNLDLADVIFLCGNYRVSLGIAHSLVLSMYSPLLKKQVTDTKEDPKYKAGSYVKVLVSADRESVREFLRFLYQKECNLTAKNVHAIAGLVDQFKIGIFKEIYGQQIFELKMMANVNNADAFGFLERSVKGGFGYMEKEVLNYIRVNMRTVIYQPGGNLSIEDILLKVLNFDSIASEQFLEEVEIFNVVMKWLRTANVNADGKAKRHMLGKSLTLIRFPAMSDRDFSACLYAERNLLTAEEIESITEDIVTGMHQNEFGFKIYPRINTLRLKELIIFKPDKNVVKEELSDDAVFYTEFTFNAYQNRYIELLGLKMLCPSGEVTISLFSALNMKLVQTMTHACSPEKVVYRFSKNVALEPHKLYKIKYEFNTLAAVRGFENTTELPLVRVESVQFEFFKVGPHISAILFYEILKDVSKSMFK